MTIFPPFVLLYYWCSRVPLILNTWPRACIVTGSEQFGIAQDRHLDSKA